MDPDPWAQRLDRGRFTSSLDDTVGAYAQLLGLSLAL